MYIFLNKLLIRPKKRMNENSECLAGNNLVTEALLKENTLFDHLCYISFPNTQGTHC